VSPAAAFLFLTAAMVVSVPLILASRGPPDTEAGTTGNRPDAG